MYCVVCINRLWLKLKWLDVAVLGAVGYVGGIGKKGTSIDISLCALKTLKFKTWTVASY
jgi:hypothetical protein